MANDTSSTGRADLDELARRADADPHLARELAALAGLIADEAGADHAPPRKRGRRTSKRSQNGDVEIAAGE